MGVGVELTQVMKSVMESVWRSQNRAHCIAAGVQLLIAMPT
jgi:hypothetical protein